MRNTLSLSSEMFQTKVLGIARSVWNYRLCFLADSATVLFLLYWEIGMRARSWSWAALAFAGGYLIWTFTEYAFHRWIYHQPDGIFGDGHRIHHEEPLDLIAMPWFMTTATMFGIWYLGVILPLPFLASCLAGWLTGFVWYSLVHHSLHHWHFRHPWLRRLEANHRVHHQFPDTNFGVTMRYWDRVFGTMHKKTRPREVPREEEKLELSLAAGELP